MNTKPSFTALSSLVGLLGLVGLSAACGTLAGCSGSSASIGTVDLSKATLKRAQSCEDLTSALRDDARSKLNRRIDAEIRAIRQGWSYGYGYGEGDTTNAGAAAPPQAGGSGGATPAVAPAHSDTETQVKGVDEADIVKTDGNHIYLLHGNKFIVANSWPAQTLGAATSATIEGQPSEMFVANGRVVVFSRVDGAPIYAAAGVTPRPPYQDQYSPYGGGYSGGGVGMAGAPAGGVMLPPGGGGGGGGNGGYSANPLTKITVLQITGADVTPTRELYFEGDYSTSRRIDARVRVILNGGGHGPALAYSPEMPQPTPVSAGTGTVVVGPGGGGIAPPQPYTPPTTEQQIAAWEALRTKNLALIANTTYADWVPTAFVKSGSQVTATATQCADFYVPTAGTTESGMTQIESIDLDAPDALPRSTTILGAVSTVYGNTNALVLASEAYVDPWVLRQAYPPPVMTNGGTGATTTPPAIPVQTMNYTHLHAFDIASDPTTALYTGSGTVPGSVKDQFAIDEKNGAVRVATTEQRSGPARTDGKENAVSHVYVLTNDRGKLVMAGDAGEIAPGEQLYATRFVGDKAYIVTWHVTDPLFVVDVANANAPRIMGQVQIPGFSTYIHPLDDTHLLTIGRETDMTGHQHDGSYWYGIALQVFDVTNPLQPLQQYKYVFDGGEYAQSEAMEEHKAFTYFDDKKLLAFPYVHEGSYSSYTQSSTLQVFQVGVAEGIHKLGAIDHSALLGTLPNGNYGYCGGYFDGAVRRGVFVENVVYSISYGGILANDVTQLAAGGAPLATMKLDAPTMSSGCQ